MLCFVVSLLSLFSVTWACQDTPEDPNTCLVLDVLGLCYHPDFFNVMKEHCEKTCNLCDVSAPEPPPIPVNPGMALGECGRSSVPQGRVIGGTDARHGSWPWQVGLYNGDRDPDFICGGSLIRPDWVLTAAHCALLPVTTYWVRLGDWHRYYNDGTEQVRKASEIIVHPQYNHPVLYNNDIALIKLERPVVLNSHVNTICLPQPGVSVPLNSACYITGWGKVKHPGGSYHKLQQARLPLVSNAECSLGGLLNITQQMVCAGELDPNQLQGGCQGDSGGPFVCKDQTSGKFFLEGAVSWGSGSCNFNPQIKLYTVFARVSEFLDWIDQELAKN